MRQATYIQLTTPKQVKINPDPESPTVNAPVLKIIRYESMDELHAVPSIGFFYSYGFINSQGLFVQIDPTIYYQAVVDIEPAVDNVTSVPQANGRNPMTATVQPSGNWLTDMTSPTKDQPSRATGDFRAEDLYNFLVDVVGIDGTIQTQGE